jgi:hypothetical protein
MSTLCTPRGYKKIVTGEPRETDRVEKKITCAWESGWNV